MMTKNGIKLVESPGEATHSLCELNPTARGQFGKWQPVKHLVIPKGADGKAIAEYLVKQGACTERAIRRKKVRLLPARTGGEREFTEIWV